MSASTLGAAKIELTIPGIFREVFHKRYSLLSSTAEDDFLGAVLTCLVRSSE